MSPSFAEAIIWDLRGNRWPMPYATMRRALGRRPGGPVRLLTHLRYAGYVFNPVSFYYCRSRRPAMLTPAADDAAGPACANPGAPR